MWFACYLYEEGIITGDQFAQAVREQLSRRLPLGRLAIELGKLSLSEVMKILRVQADELEKSFGQIARELSYLTKEQLDLLLLAQEQQATPIGDIMLELGFIDRIQLVRETQNFRRAQTGMPNNKRVPRAS